MSFSKLITNIFSNLPDNLPEELFETLAESGPVRIERIVSHGHVTTDGEWYDQERAEWVLLLSGSAAILFEGDEAPQKLDAGDFVLIPAHRRHRVVWTDQQVRTIWLAVHFPGRAA